MQAICALFCKRVGYAMIRCGLLCMFPCVFLSKPCSSLRLSRDCASLTVVWNLGNQAATLMIRMCHRQPRDSTSHWQINSRQRTLHILGLSLDKKLVCPAVAFSLLGGVGNSFIPRNARGIDSYTVGMDGTRWDGLVPLVCYPAALLIWTDLYFEKYCGAALAAHRLGL